LADENQVPDVVYALAASPNFAEDGVCFAGRVSGLYKSADGGAIWFPAYETLDLDEAPATTAVAVSPGFRHDHSVFAGVPGGILRSVDEGKNWHFAVLPAPPPVIAALAISPDYVEDGVILAGTVEDGIFRSTHRGHKWSPSNFGLLDLGVLALAISPDFAADGTVFVGTETGLYVSTNGGRAWKETAFPPEDAPVLSLALSPSYAEDGMIWAGTEASGLLVSDDGGRTWRRHAAEHIADAVNAVDLFPGSTGLHALVLTPTAALISRDGGGTWTVALRTGENRTLASAIAPQGLAPGAPLLVGLADGSIDRIDI
jgi:photosystem II stability/assembly factor-like uncharacterized protein